MMTNDDGDYVGLTDKNVARDPLPIKVKNKKIIAQLEAEANQFAQLERLDTKVFPPAAGGSNSPAAAKYSHTISPAAGENVSFAGGITSAAAGDVVSPAAAESILTIPQPPGKRRYQRKQKLSSPAAAELDPPAAGGVSSPPAGDVVSERQWKHIIVSKPHSKDYDPIGNVVIDKLQALYAKELDSGVDGVTKVCHYQGLQGLGSSHHTIPQPLREVLKLPDRMRTLAQQNALAAFGYQVLMGQV